MNLMVNTIFIVHLQTVFKSQRALGLFINTSDARTITPPHTETLSFHFLLCDKAVSTSCR